MVRSSAKCIHQPCSLISAGLQILAMPDTKVVATARSPSKADDLQSLAQQYAGRLLIVALDLADNATVQVHICLQTSACRLHTL